MEGYKKLVYWTASLSFFGILYGFNISIHKINVSRLKKELIKAEEILKFEQNNYFFNDDLATLSDSFQTIYFDNAQNKVDSLKKEINLEYRKAYLIF